MRQVSQLEASEGIRQESTVRKMSKPRAHRAACPKELIEAPMGSKLGHGSAWRKIRMAQVHWVCALHAAIAEQHMLPSTAPVMNVP